MNGQYKDGMIYPPLPKQTEGYHGDYWTEDDLTGYALDFWKANTTPQPAQADTTPAAHGVGDDTARLNLISSEYLHLVPFEMPTGAGDADVGWSVSQSSMSGEVELVRHHSDDLRMAIDAAETRLFQAASAPGGCDG